MNEEAARAVGVDVCVPWVDERHGESVSRRAAVARLPRHALVVEAVKGADEHAGLAEVVARRRTCEAGVQPCDGALVRLRDGWLRWWRRTRRRRSWGRARQRRQQRWWRRLRRRRRPWRRRRRRRRRGWWRRRRQWRRGRGGRKLRRQSRRGAHHPGTDRRARSLAGSGHEGGKGAANHHHSPDKGAAARRAAPCGGVALPSGLHLIGIQGAVRLPLGLLLHLRLLLLRAAALVLGLLAAFCLAWLRSIESEKTLMCIWHGAELGRCGVGRRPKRLPRRSSRLTGSLRHWERRPSSARDVSPGRELLLFFPLCAPLHTRGSSSRENIRQKAVARRAMHGFGTRPRAPTVRPGRRTPCTRGRGSSEAKGGRAPLQRPSHSQSVVA